MGKANQKKKSEDDPVGPLYDMYVDVDTLHNSYDIKGKQDRRHYFDDAELGELKDQFFTVNQFLNQRLTLTQKCKELIHSGLNAELLKEQIDELQFTNVGEASVKELKRQNAELLSKTSDGFEDRNLMLFGLAYHELGRMVFYREDGHYEYDRPIYPSERQGSILSLKNPN